MNLTCSEFICKINDPFTVQLCLPELELTVPKSGWLGRAMVLGSFQCRGILLLWHMVGQGPTVLAAGAGWVGYVLLFYFIFCF